MKYFKDFLTNKTFLILAIITLIPIFLHMRQIEWPALNSDEASFAYNAYSILKTGKDEYGSFMPTRFKAFGENKLPVTIYAMVPGIALFGLSETAARLPFILIGVLSPLMFFMLTRKLTGNPTIALIAAFLASFSPWIQIMSRHIHENIIILALLMAMLWYLIDLSKKVTTRSLVILAILVGIGLFTYHIGKVLAVFVSLWVGYFVFFQKENKHFIKSTILLFTIPLILFGVTELMHPSSRISNLFLTSTPGFQAGVQQLRAEHNSQVIHNKGIYAVSIFTHQYLSYFSPEFLVVNGDNNVRFGFAGISPITSIEYILMFIGIYFIFRNKLEYRWILLSLFCIAPLSAALSWQAYSLTRSFIMIIPIILFVSYGIYYAVNSCKRLRLKMSFIGLGLALILFFTFLNWDFYFVHYPKRPEVLAAWQAGYKEVGEYFNGNYDSFDRFYVTKKLGQPYIFTLFYTQFSPHTYQQQASLSAPDEYGFGQVEKFDKYIFSFQHPDPQESAAVIGYPGEFSESIDMSRVQKITINNQEIFWIYEGQRKK